MAVHGEGYDADADFQDGVTDFWCVQTAKALGPDGESVGLTACCHAERGCYREY
jgi:hypothetical protein